MVFLPLDFIFPVCRENGMVVNHCHLVINDRSFSVIKLFDTLKLLDNLS